MEVINVSKLTCKEVSDKLKKLEKKTPKTDEFDGLYGQKERRWWDKLEKKGEISTQQYHIVLYFICKYYNGAKFNCSKCPKKCEECYVNNSYRKKGA